MPRVSKKFQSHNPFLESKRPISHEQKKNVVKLTFNNIFKGFSKTLSFQGNN